MAGGSPVNPALTSSPASWEENSDRAVSVGNRPVLPTAAGALSTTMRTTSTRRSASAAALAAAVLAAAALAGAGAAAPRNAVEVTFVGDSVAGLDHLHAAGAGDPRPRSRSPARPAGVPPARDGELQLPGNRAADRAAVGAGGRPQARGRAHRRRRLQRVGGRLPRGNRPDHARRDERRARSASSG